MTRPRQVCRQHGCATLVDRGFCAQHQPARLALRQPTDRRYGTMAWRRYSRQRLAEHPWCARCDQLAELTHHRVPVVEAPERFADPTNHESACRRCNRQAEADHHTRHRGGAVTSGAGANRTSAARSVCSPPNRAGNASSRNEWEGTK
jgi:5-methylcytosine-specific restriction endonuclease McrA